jgi:hypothetical protein
MSYVFSLPHSVRSAYLCHDHLPPPTPGTILSALSLSLQCRYSPSSTKPPVSAALNRSTEMQRVRELLSVGYSRMTDKQNAVLQSGAWNGSGIPKGRVVCSFSGEVARHEEGSNREIRIGQPTAWHTHAPTHTRTHAWQVPVHTAERGRARRRDGGGYWVVGRMQSAFNPRSSDAESVCE